MRVEPRPDTVPGPTERLATPEPPNARFDVAPPPEKSEGEPACAEELPATSDFDLTLPSDHEEFELVSARGLRAIKERWERRRRRE